MSKLNIFKTINSRHKDNFNAKNSAKQAHSLSMDGTFVGATCFMKKLKTHFLASMESSCCTNSPWGYKRREFPFFHNSYRSCKKNWIFLRFPNELAMTWTWKDFPIRLCGEKGNTNMSCRFCFVVLFKYALMVTLYQLRLQTSYNKHYRLLARMHEFKSLLKKKGHV